MTECKCCHNFAAQGDYDARGNIKKLYSSADDGCTTCGIMRQAIQQLLPEQPDLESEWVAWSMKTKDRTDMFHPADSTHWELLLRVELEPFYDLQIYATSEEPSPWDMVPLDHHLPTSTGSEESYAFALKALSECLTTHRLCDSPAGDFVPFRLVDVGDPDTSQVRVIETPGTSAAESRYCALSHCWGPPESITTQLNDVTYPDFKRGIPIASLPQTFLDAVLFTRKLGQRYLWIDSLCIIQGNQDDWHTQGADMCRIYENAVLTLAAAASSSGAGGLFYPSPRVEISGNAPEKSGKAYRVFARPSIAHDFFGFPLMNRAWVLQERLLSPRTLYFARQELVWECRARNACQCSPVLGGFRDRVVGFPENSKLQPAARHLDSSALVAKWHEVVGVYTQLQLTKPGDKLMAVDGVAQFMAPIRRGSRYCAGAWEDSFAFDLAWVVDTFDEKRGRALEWRAPTWSWASMESKTWWQTEEGDTPTPEPNFGIERWPMLPQDGRLLPDSFLRLRGVLVKITVAEADIVVNTSPCLYEDCAEWTPSDGHTRDDEPIYCLRLFQSENMLCSLALKKIGPERNYLFERHGLLIFSANPDEENDTWNTRDKTRTKWSRNYQKGYPVWWTGGSTHVVTIV